MAAKTATNCYELSGLQLTFNIDQDEYSGYLAPNAGVRVVVHPQRKDVPFPEDEGIICSSW